MAKQPYKQYLHLNAEKEKIVSAVFAILKPKHKTLIREDVYSVISQYEKLILTHVARNHATEYRWDLITIGRIFINQKGTPKIPKWKMKKIMRNERMNSTLDETFFAV